MLQKKILNPFYPNVPFLYPLKTSENQNQRFSDIFKGYRTKVNSNTKIISSLLTFNSTQCSISMLPENVRKPKVFGRFQGIQKWTFFFFFSIMLFFHGH